MRHTPLLKIIVTTAVLCVCSISEAIADDEVFEASTVIESSVSGGAMSIESTLGSSAAEVSSTVAAASTQEPFDAALYIVFAMGLIGLVWVRRHVQSL